MSDVRWMTPGLDRQTHLLFFLLPERLSPQRESGEGQRPRGGPAGSTGSPPCAVCAAASCEPHGPTHLQGDPRVQLTNHSALEKGPQLPPACWLPHGPQLSSLPPAADWSPQNTRPPWGPRHPPHPRPECALLHPHPGYKCALCPVRLCSQFTLLSRVPHAHGRDLSGSRPP